MEVQLTIEQPNGSVSHHRFNEEPVTIGSAIANHIVFDDADLAPHQLIIFREKETWVIRSLAQGLEIVCDDRVLAHGETYPLNLEATIKMGEYSVLWCAEAAPEGVQNELARPRVLETTAVGEGREPVKRVNLGRRAHDGLETEEGFDLISSNRVETAENARNPLTEEDPDPILQAESTDLPSDQSVQDLADDLTELVDEMVQDELTYEGDLDLGLSPVPDPVHREEEQPETGTDLRISMEGYRRMAPFHAFPLQVNVTGAGPGRSEGQSRSHVRVIPNYPGCLVTPASARLDLTRESVGMNFWVTPVASGRYEDAWIQVVWEGDAPARIQMPCVVVRQTMMKIWAFLAMLTGFMTFFQQHYSWGVESFLARVAPSRIATPVLSWIDTMGGLVNSGLALTALFLLLALAFLLLQRPKKITLTAIPDRNRIQP